MSNIKKTTDANVNRETTKKVEVQDNIKEENIIEKSEMCKVTYIDDLIYINFKGFGLITKNEKGITDPEIKVYYYGEVGEPNFKFRI